MEIIERGWGGHFVQASLCAFRRNTLIVGEQRSIVVSTVGQLHLKYCEYIQTIGSGSCYYETKAFLAVKVGEYVDADLSQEVFTKSEYCLRAESPETLPPDADNLANDMHEAAVLELSITVDIATEET